MLDFNIEKVLEHLPHRYPFLLVDRVLDYVKNERLTAIKNVTYNEPYFMGHFPERPVMPGVLIVEAIAQATGLLAFITEDQKPKEGGLYFLTGIDNTRFKRVVEPGDQLTLEVQVTRIRKEICKFKGTASVNGELACTTDLMTFRREGE